MAALRAQVNLVGFGRRCSRIFNDGQRIRFQSSFKQALAEEEKHAEGTLSNWKKISLFIALPTTLAIGYKAFFVDHEEHPDEEKYIPYSHIRIRNKPFPWGDGDHSLFHNEHVNFGFEKSDEEPEEGVAEPKEDVRVVEREGICSFCLHMKHFITKFIVDYLMDDPEDNRRKKNEHMALLRQRSVEYLEKKRKKQYPPEPIDLDAILAASSRATELGVDGY